MSGFNISDNLENLTSLVMVMMMSIFLTDGAPLFLFKERLFTAMMDKEISASKCHHALTSKDKEISPDPKIEFSGREVKDHQETFTSLLPLLAIADLY